jgi:hypothetical protein
VVECSNRIHKVAFTLKAFIAQVCHWMRVSAALAEAWH